MTAEQHLSELFERARGAYTAGRLEESFAIGKEMESLAPADQRTWIVLGQAAMRLGKFKDAARNLTFLVEQEPSNLELRRHLTQALVEIGYFEEAVEAFHPNFEQSPEVLEKYTYFGNLNSLAGHADEAVKWFEKADQMAPGNADILAALAWARVQQGNFDKAKGLLSRVFEINPAHPRALVIKAGLAPGDMTGEELGSLGDAASDPAAHPGQRIDAAFAYARAISKTGAADDVFAAFETANRLAGEFFALRGERYDEEKDKGAFKGITSLFTKELVSKAGPAGVVPAVPVFIIGLPRSGTTLVEQILSSHSQVSGGGELKLLGEMYLRLEDIASRSEGLGKEHILERMAPEWRAEFAAKLAGLAKQGSRFVTDKMPLNYPYVGLARVLFPEAKFIFLKRNALDNCLSMYFQPLTDSYPASTSLENLGRYYRQFEEYLDFWSKIPAIDAFDLAYEDLVAAQEKTTRKLIDFLGLTWEEACLEFYKNQRPVQTLSNVQVREPITEEGVGRWKQFEKHLTPLKTGLGLAGK